MESSSKLYEILKNCKKVDGTGPPEMGEAQFQQCNDEFGKEVFRETLATFVATERPSFPLKQNNKDVMVESFEKLKMFNTSKLLKPIEQLEKEVFEKYDNYKYPWTKWGIGLIDTPATLNNASGYFHEHLRLNCGCYTFEPPMDVWENGTPKDIWRCMGAMWRGVSGVFKREVRDTETGEIEEKLVGGKLDKETYVKAFRLGTYIATQFKPVVAKAIYDMTDAKRVLDTSCGWGDRLCGFFASNAEEFIGCDPNPNTFKQYQEQCIEYEKILDKSSTKNPIVKSTDDFFISHGKKKVIIYRSGAEDIPWESIENVDCAFTSPPYFATEEYNKGGEHEEDQSWFKFNEYDRWRDDFFLPVSQHSFDSLSDRGFLLVNIMNPKINNVVYPSCDDLVDLLEPNFIGQVGMRIMQRPQGKSKFKTEEGTFDKGQLDEFMDKRFIENVWCFQKNKSDFDLFRTSRKSTLESFF